MDFERMSGDDGLRNAERAFNADPYNEQAQEAYFTELNRRGIFNNKKGRAAQEQLYAALSARSTPEAATTRMNQILERFQMEGAVVPVESLPQAGAGTQDAGSCWVSWRSFSRPQTEAESKESGNKEMVKVPGRIAMIYRVPVPRASTAKLIDDGHYNYVTPSIRTEAAAIEAAPGADTAQEVQDIPTAVFDRTVTTDEAKAWLDENELRASMRLMLTIASQLPEGIDLPWMVALDEAWLSRGSVPVLSVLSSVRGLNLNGRANRWNDGYRFPAARKKN